MVRTTAADASAGNARERLDAEEREAMLRSMERARASRLKSAGSVPSSPSRAKDESPGDLDKGYVRERVMEIVPLIKECYENTLRDHPDLAGRMVVRLTIVGEESVGGLVESSEVTEDSTIREPAMVECVRESMYALRMTAPRGGGRVEIAYPFVFRTDGPPDGGE